MLVTGGSGYLGAALLRLRPDARGTYLTTPVPGGLRLDIRDADAVRRAVAGHEAVIHTAYLQEDASVIVDGSTLVAEACTEAGARLVHLSTDSVFAGDLGRPYTEADEARPITDYGRAKLEAEHAVAAACPRAAIVRTSLIYGGPGLAPSRQERDSLDAETNFFTDEFRSPVQVDELAAALLELARTDHAGVLHMGGADDVSRYEFARLLIAARGGDPDVVRSASLHELGLNRPADCRMDSSRARELLRSPLRGAREVLVKPS